MIDLMRTQNGNTDDLLGGIQNAVIVDLPNNTWTNGVVPYVLDSSATSELAL